MGNTVFAETVRELALALPESSESAHFDKVSFRVRKKIFATLRQDGKHVVLKLSLDDQNALTMLNPDAFSALDGYWGAQGWTLVKLSEIERDEFESALESAWRQVAPKRLITAQRK